MLWRLERSSTGTVLSFSPMPRSYPYLSVWLRPASVWLRLASAQLPPLRACQDTEAGSLRVQSL